MEAKPPDRVKCLLIDSDFLIKFLKIILISDVYQPNWSFLLITNNVEQMKLHIVIYFHFSIHNISWIVLPLRNYHKGHNTNIIYKCEIYFNYHISSLMSLFLSSQFSLLSEKDTKARWAKIAKALLINVLLLGLLFFNFKYINETLHQNNTNIVFIGKICGICNFYTNLY